VSILWFASIGKNAFCVYCDRFEWSGFGRRTCPLLGNAEQLRALRVGQLEIPYRLYRYDRMVAQDTSGICCFDLALGLALSFWSSHFLPWWSRERFERGILCLWFAGMVFLGSWFLQGLAFPFLVGRSLFRAIGQTNGPCLDGFYVCCGLDALEDEEGFPYQGPPRLYHAVGLRLSGLRLSVYRGGDKTVPCFKLE
jgi:hypothetical protein